MCKLDDDRTVIIPRCPLLRTCVTEGAEQQYRGEKTYTTYACGNELPCTSSHPVFASDAPSHPPHDATVTLGDSCPTCGGCEWVCAEGMGAIWRADAINAQIRHILLDVTSWEGVERLAAQPMPSDMDGFRQQTIQMARALVDVARLAKEVNDVD